MSILRVQEVNAGSTGRNATSFGFTMTAPVNGNVIFAMIGGVANTNAVTSISQTGVTWTRLVQFNGATTSFFLELWQGIVGSGAATTGTVNFSAGNASGVFLEYSGFPTSGILDKTNTQDNVAQSNISTGTTATTTQPTELWLNGWVSSVADSATPTMTFSSPNNGYAYVDAGFSTQTFSGITSRVYTGVSEKIVSATGTAGGTINVSDSVLDATFNSKAMAVSLIATQSNLRDDGGGYFYGGQY